MANETLQGDRIPTVFNGRAIIPDKIVITYKHVGTTNTPPDSAAEVATLSVVGHESAPSASDYKCDDVSLVTDHDLIDEDDSPGCGTASYYVKTIQCRMVSVIDLQWTIGYAENILELTSIVLITKHGVKITLA